MYSIGMVIHTMTQYNSYSVNTDCIDKANEMYVQFRQNETIERTKVEVDMLLKYKTNCILDNLEDDHCLKNKIWWH